MPKRLATLKRSVFLAACAVGIVSLAVILQPAHTGRGKGPVRADQIARAVYRFTATQRPVPDTVTFSQLIARGYLPANMLREFGAAEITVNLKTDEAMPQMFLMDALMPDGTHNVLLSDGSVQGFARSMVPAPAATIGPPARTNIPEASLSR